MICPACTSRLAQKAFEVESIKKTDQKEKSGRFIYFRCKFCMCLFLGNQAADEAFFQEHYNDEYYHRARDFLGIGRFLTKFANKRKEKLIVESLEQKGKIKLLDVGCGFGEFLEALDEDRFVKSGTEISKECVDVCRSKGIKIFKGNILDVDLGTEEFDAITLWHVLEHLQNPREVLAKLTNQLKNDGILLVSTPNVESLGFRLAGKKWYHLDAPRHLVLYSQRSLKELGESAGLKITNQYSLPSEFPTDLFWSLLATKTYSPLLLIYPLLKTVSRDTIQVLYAK